MPPLGEDEEEDPFWRVQLVNNADKARRPFESEAPRSDYQDHALPVGTEVTDESLAGVLGREHEVCVPVTSSIISNNAGDDGDDRGKSSSSSNNSSSSSNNSGSSNNNNNSSSDENNSREWLGQALVLKLRQVNGDGVMSGVGGDVWCAALLLSAWLLENPEAVRGLDVLELGSGLGLCGITAGYLAKSITLTDYVDELLVNLRHNIEANRVPRVASTVAPGKPIENRRSRSGQGGEGADGAPATAPQRRRPEPHQAEQYQGGRQQDRQKQQQQQQQQQEQQQRQQQQQQQHIPQPEHPQHLHGSDALLQEPMAGTSSPRRRRPPIPHDCASPVDTAREGGGGGGGGPVRIDDQERRRHGDSPVRLATATATATASDSVVFDGGKGLLPPVPPLQRTPLLPLSRTCVRVRKLDWTTYAGDGEARRASGEAAEGGGWWWDDQGPDANQPGTMAPAGSQLLESDSLRCDVAVGSALVYSPHHACVADVLSHLFAEGGGCRAAYVVQLSTRPGFDDFLHRLGACGLRYRLERISTVLPTAILNEIRRSARGAVTGGPVTRVTDPAVACDVDGDDDTDGDCLQHRDNENDSGDDGVGRQQGEASGFDEFVLCSVFRPGDL